MKLGVSIIEIIGILLLMLFFEPVFFFFPREAPAETEIQLLLKSAKIEGTSVTTVLQPCSSLF